jgi:cytochrome c oxidase assembly protein subunit 15
MKEERKVPGQVTASSPGLHRFAIVCVAATFTLIFVGGLVTSTGSALAVPDWPLAYGHLIPKLEGGVRFEYGHRVVAGVVVILTAILATWSWYSEPRRWVRNIALAAFGLVIVQAILGGITVLLLLPLAIAVAHAATAQAFFCLIVAMAVFTNPRFAGAAAPKSGDRPAHIARLATVTTGIIYLQILIGAVMRHLGAGLAIPDFPLSFGHLVPPLVSIYVDINFAHRCGALVVASFVIWLAARVIASRSAAYLRSPAYGLLVLLVLQVTLGALTIWSGRAVIPTTAHVAVGAALLATCVMLTLRASASEELAWTAEADRVRGNPRPAMERKVTV